MCIFTENFIRLFLEKMIIFKQRSVANINYFTEKKKYVTPFKRLNGTSRFLVM